MNRRPVDFRRATTSFLRFVRSLGSGGGLLLISSAIALLLANSAWGPAYHHVLEHVTLGLSLEQWINDGLMAVFFLLIGLELERELYSGELSDRRRATLPAVAAVGGMLVPATIHYLLNADTPTQRGAGIPMATDIAFALAALSLLKTRVPASLRVLLVAFAVMDDLGAIIVIALFYTTDLALTYLIAAAAIWTLLFVLNTRFRVMALAPYLIGGALMWWLTLRSGVHATLAGVALAFAIPYSSRDDDMASPSHRLELKLHRPVALFILPVFALANTGLDLSRDLLAGITSPNGLGIFFGLLGGKPIGVVAAVFAGVASGLCLLPRGLRWSHVIGAGLLGGIGFTMSIFITNLAYADAPDLAASSKLSVFVASGLAGLLGLSWLRFVAPRAEVDDVVDVAEE